MAYHILLAMYLESKSNFLFDNLFSLRYIKTMKKLICFISMICLLGSNIGDTAEIRESRVKGIPFYIYNAASQFKLDSTLLYALCTIESRCNPKAINHSDGTPEQKAAGITVKSYGLFQLQTATAEALGFKLTETVTVEKMRHGKLVKIKQIVDHSRDLLDPQVNTWYAAKLLSSLRKKYGSIERALSAYNAGSPIKSNKDYVSKVLKQYAIIKLDGRF